MLHPQIKISCRPNNQITLTRANYRARARQISQAPIHEHDRINYSDVVALAHDIQGHRDCYYAVKANSQKRPAPKLDIIKKSQRSKKSPRLKQHRPKSFTRFSGQRLREAGAAMSIACQGQHQRCREVTLTLPANHQEAFEALARDSDYVINRLFQPIRREWGATALWFFVWEYQKRGALHVHIAIYNECEHECERMADKLIRQWHDVLVSVGERQNTCMFSQKRKDRCTIRQNHQSHTAPIKKDVACYFAKYAGKTESKNEWYCQKYPVSRFWGSSRSIKKIVRENSFEFTWDMMGGDKVYDSRFEDIIENILCKINVLTIQSYEFNVTMKGKHRINRYKNGRNVIAFEEDRCVASGTRYTLYVDSGDYHKAIDLSRELSVYF